MKFKNSLNQVTEDAQKLKALDLNLDTLSSVPGTHVVEGEQQLPQISTCVLWHAPACKYMNK